MNDTDKKFQVDEDWKKRVEAEKQALAEKERSQEETDERPPLPEASFQTLLSNFATQALMWLGQIPDPTTGQPSVDLPVARFAIDTIEVIQKKTEGNLTEREAHMVESTLHELRMAYLTVAKNPEAFAAPPSPGTETPEAPGESKSRIITP